jgi:hypothetical protein
MGGDARGARVEREAGVKDPAMSASAVATEPNTPWHIILIAAT